MSSPIRLVIDTDAGVDDAQAILMALRHEAVNVEAITTVKGNTDAKQCALNVLRILKVVDMETKVPVHVGCETALLGVSADSSYYHGKDGLGDNPDPTAPGPELLQKEHGVTALCRLVNENPGVLSLAMIGPVTNLAVALRLDPDIGKKLKHCYIMGGNIYGEGNVTPAAEYNFAADPEAASVVLNELKCPITIVPWETCSQGAMTWDIRDNLRARGGKIYDFLASIEQFSMKQSKAFGWQYLLADEWLMSCVLEPDVIAEKVTRCVQIECGNGVARGLMIVDWQQRHWNDHSKAVNLVKKINTEAVMQMIAKLFDPK